MTDFPMLRLLARHGNALAIVVAASFPLAAVVAITQGCSPWWLAAGAVAGLICYGTFRSYVELICVMTDMLLPK